MRQVIKILLVVFRQRGGGLFRYKIAYRRTVYTGYDKDSGDELDGAIWDYFAAQKPTQLILEVNDYDGVRELTIVLTTFTPKQIPLIISATIDYSSLNVYELDSIQNSNQSFPIQNRLVTLYYRSNMDEQHQNWDLLPTLIQIALDYKNYIPLSQTIFPL